MTDYENRREQQRAAARTLLEAVRRVPVRDQVFPDALDALKTHVAALDGHASLPDLRDQVAEAQRLLARVAPRVVAPQCLLALQRALSRLPDADGVLYTMLDDFDAVGAPMAIPYPIGMRFGPEQVVLRMDTFLDRGVPRDLRKRLAEMSREVGDLLGVVEQACSDLEDAPFGWSVRRAVMGHYDDEQGVFVVAREELEVAMAERADEIAAVEAHAA